MSRVAFITGGTKGIGRAVAERIAIEGFDLILTYASDILAAQKAAHEINRLSGRTVHIIRADSANLVSIADTVAQITEITPKLDLLIFNAGLTYRASFEEMQLDEWQRVFNANVHYPVFFLQATVGMLNRESSVIFTGSLMGIHPHALSLVYGVTKSSVHALVKNLVKFMAPYGVRVNGVVPGFVDTEWQQNKPAEVRENIENKLAQQRFCTPQEVADAYLLLVNNRYFNGELITIDGGYSYR